MQGKVHAADRCAQLAKNLRITTEEIADDESFERERTQFCDEYSSSDRKTDSSSFGFDCEALGLSSTSSSGSAQEVFDKYCRDEETEENQKRHYRS